MKIELYENETPLLVTSGEFINPDVWKLRKYESYHIYYDDVLVATCFPKTDGCKLSIYPHHVIYQWSEGE
jgi:hypothetical protein